LAHKLVAYKTQNVEWNVEWMYRLW